MLDFHRADLARLAARDRLRVLAPMAGKDFASNDYLGLASHPRLAAAIAEAVGQGVPVGSGGSRLLRGNHPEHEALEAEAAAFFGAEASLYFSSGYTANVAILATLPQRGDLIVHDALVHASMHEGMRLSRAQSVAAAHNDPGAVAQAIRAWRDGGGKGTPWIAVESLYSMDGDTAPLADLYAVAEQHDAMLIVDEAHAPASSERAARVWQRPASGSSPSIPAARRWGAKARWSRGRPSSATIWSIAGGGSSSRPRPRR